MDENTPLRLIHEFPMLCCFCENKEFESNEYKRHLWYCHTDKFTCYLCHDQFGFASDLKKHLVCHGDSYPYICKYCDGTFDILKNLDKHLTSHDQSENYICELCSKTFQTESGLTHHMVRCHSIGAPIHTCSVCGKEYNRADKFKIHEMIHTGEKPHACSVCGMAFRRKDHMRRHERSHENPNSKIKRSQPEVNPEKNQSASRTKRKKATEETNEEQGLSKVKRQTHACKQCGQVYIYKRALRTHIKQGKTFPSTCAVCNAHFCSRRALKAHVDSQHNFDSDANRIVVQPDLPFEEASQNSVVKQDEDEEIQFDFEDYKFENETEAERREMEENTTCTLVRKEAYATQEKRSSPKQKRTD